ncbi:hypothetical protein PINS_up017433 [Pythium insidiosum]|nr:hypothetical protein PINS_up017433 [Pythium insidiosum]
MRRKQTTLADTVKFYNTLFGSIMFTAGKAFEIGVETLVLPTIHTYLHNCPLYPGDQPQRVSSATKSNFIFWGLKAIVVLMNVGTSSLYVSQKMVNDKEFRNARRLSTLAAVDDDAHSTLGRLLGHPAAPFQWSHTDASASSLSAVDVDYTSQSLAFPRRDWSGVLADSARDADPEVAVSVSLAACAVDDCRQRFADHGVDVYRDVVPLVRSGLAVWRDDLGLSTAQNASSSLSELMSEVASLAHQDHAQDADLTTAKLTFKRVSYASGVRFSSVAVDVARSSQQQSQDVLCGASRCVLKTSLEPRPRVVAAASSAHDDALSVFGLARAAAVDAGVVKETLTLTMGSLAWSEPLRVSLTGGDELVLPYGSTARRSKTTTTTTIAALSAIVFADGPSEATTWLPVPESYKPLSSRHHEPLVDAFVKHFESTAAAVASDGAAVGPVALAFVVQDGVPASSLTIATQRRLADSDTPTRPTRLVLGVPKSNAIATFTGCGIMALLTLFVIWRPTSRVRLSPNTTPGAQYLQILTDDLYPDIVHKKRLKFADGDRFPFDDYVIDSIVLYRKDDTSQKVYL